MKILRDARGYSLIDLSVGLVLLGIVLLSIYALYRPTFRLSRDSGDRLAAQQDVRLAVDRIGALLRESTTAFGRMRVYSVNDGCTGAYEGCIGFVSARDGECKGSFHIAAGAADWRATVYVWRDTAANELRLRCDPGTTFPPATWPGPALEPYAVIARNVAASAFAVEPAGGAERASVAVALTEQTKDPQGSATRFFTRTVFVPQNR
jgi:hypothetical protein